MTTKSFLDDFGFNEKESTSTITEMVPAEKGLRVSEPKKGRISHSRSGLVKLRDRPNAVGKVIGFLREGDVVTVLRDEDPSHYYKVKVDGTGMIGYLSKEFYEEE